jgi:hypothetical protein
VPGRNYDNHTHTLSTISFPSSTPAFDSDALRPGSDLLGMSQFHPSVCFVTRCAAPVCSFVWLMQVVVVLAPYLLELVLVRAK